MICLYTGGLAVKMSGITARLLFGVSLRRPMAGSISSRA